MLYHGSCSCGHIRYTLALASPDDAHTTLCHCKNCKRFTGSAFELACRVPKDALKITAGETTKHAAENGSGRTVYREFCGVCGSGILEYGERAKDTFRFVFTGTLDDPEAFPLEGEIFCKDRSKWLPEIPGIYKRQEKTE